MNVAKIALVGGIAALALAVAAVAGVGRSDAAPKTDQVTREISVSGTGSVTVTPDRAHFSFGVDTKGKTASGALAENAAEMQKVIAALKGAGIDSKDIQTEQFSLSPISNDEETAVIGYSASNSVSVLVRRLGAAGALIDRAVAAGATQVDGPSLDRADAAALYRKALEAAIADARSKAETIATASGLTLGRATAVSESTQAPPVTEVYKAAAADVSATPIEAGTAAIQATVSVSYEAA
jgi:uncharacterized protein YggE